MRSALRGQGSGEVVARTRNPISSLGKSRHGGTSASRHTTREAQGHQPTATCSAQWRPLSKHQPSPPRGQLGSSSILTYGGPQLGTHIFCRLQRAQAVYNRPLERETTSETGQGRIVKKERWVPLPGQHRVSLKVESWWDPGASTGANLFSPAALCRENPFISLEMNPLVAQLKSAPSCKFRSGYDLATGRGRSGEQVHCQVRGTSKPTGKQDTTSA